MCGTFVCRWILTFPSIHTSPCGSVSSHTWSNGSKDNSFSPCTKLSCLECAVATLKATQMNPTNEFRVGYMRRLRRMAEGACQTMRSCYIWVKHPGHLEGTGDRFLMPCVLVYRVVQFWYHQNLSWSDFSAQQQVAYVTICHFSVPFQLCLFMISHLLKHLKTTAVS